jgi:hypothetical protein
VLFHTPLIVQSPFWRDDQTPLERRRAKPKKGMWMTALLLSAISLWLSINFDLPSGYDHPIEIAPASEITFSPQQQSEGLVSSNGAAIGQPLDLVATYDDRASLLWCQE